MWELQPCQDHGNVGVSVNAVAEVWDAEVLPKLSSHHCSDSVSVALTEKYHGEPVCIPFIVSLYSHCWEMKARGGRHKKRKLPCLSRNWWLSIHGVCAFLTPSSTSRGASGAFPFLRPQPRLFLLGKTGQNLELCADPPSSALQLASLAFVLEVEAVGVVVGAQGAGEARGHGGVTQARLPLAPALPITCGTGGNTEPCGAFPGRNHRGESAACPGPCPPQNPIELSQAGGSGAGFPRGCSPVCRAPGWGVWGSSAQNSPQVMCPSLELKLYRVLRGLHSPSLSLL